MSGNIEHLGERTGKQCDTNYSPLKQNINLTLFFTNIYSTINTDVQSLNVMLGLCFISFLYLFSYFKFKLLKCKRISASLIRSLSQFCILEYESHDRLSQEEINGEINI